MKIVHLANHVRKTGNGIVNMMVDLACTQAAAGHDVTVASSGGAFEPLLAQHGVKHVTLAQSRKPWRAPSMMLGFNRLIARCDPDIVHAHMMTGALLGRFATIRRRYALITTVHNEFQKSASLMRVGDRVVAVSKAVAASMAKRGVRGERLCVVRNGTIGTPRLAPEAMPVSPALSRPSIVTVAGMYERKGIQDLLRAFAQVRERLPGAALYLVGDGPDRAAMEALAHELGIAEHAHFTGFVANPRAHLAEADVFVLASHREPGGLVLCEAREAGCAIVATQVDGNPEMLDDGEAGLLVPPASPAALAAALERLLTDEAGRAAWRARARRNLDTFGVQHVCDAYLSIYERTLDEVQPRGRARSTDARVPSPDGVMR
ncbi:glycosyltransferase family 4 protein [Paraburkholderia sp. Tr-20389]|uniref:glycosyltransferase family 4 protein n=1 Tax=Paraburkholderia sp. Tr-20389 TaxID=2703903 RepID=UPI001981F4AB|nr:glycosyltransferase family 4 protein [Paraburkholderia sp. Tr-20389]MBN3757131.1 glycosyltransferase family 4 protein [Paraburkholderia sp. Tr-20389]